MPTEPTIAEPPKRKRRWFQFSLRTLMLAIAILAVQCAVCMPMLREWQRQREIDKVVKQIESRWARFNGHPGLTRLTSGAGAESSSFNSSFSNSRPSTTAASVVNSINALFSDYRHASSLGTESGWPMTENSGHRFQFRLGDAMLAMTICCVVAAQLVVTHPDGRVFAGTISAPGKVISGLNFVILVVAWRFYKSNRRGTLWIATAATIIATIVGVLIGKLAG